jgi:ribosome-associated protein
MSESYLEIQLDKQPIELCKLLKIADLVSGGGEAKVVISEGYVLLNGEVEYQKRKKVYDNDIVEFNGEVLQVIVNEDLVEADVSSFSETIESVSSAHESYAKSSPDEKGAKKSKSKAINKKKAAPINEGTAQNNKRKPISF